MSTKILLRRHINSSVDIKSIILDAGEPFYDITTKKLYIGDGVNTIENLTSINSFTSAEEITNAINNSNTSISGSKISGTVPNATNASFAVGASRATTSVGSDRIYQDSTHIDTSPYYDYNAIKEIATGTAGPTGPTGPQGIQGVQGPTGKQGAASVIPGPMGPTGRDGRDGQDGPQGPTGPAGQSGASIDLDTRSGPIVVVDASDHSKIGFPERAWVDPDSKIYAMAFISADVTNDYAELRDASIIENRDDVELFYGRVFYEKGDDLLELSDERLLPCSYICSDTYGFLTGEETEKSIPVALCGRALAYTFEDKNRFKIGDAVCSAPGGTVSRMSRREIRKYPDRILGYVSSIPNYEFWGKDNKIFVDDRIWIKIK